MKKWFISRNLSLYLLGAVSFIFFSVSCKARRTNAELASVGRQTNAGFVAYLTPDDKKDPTESYVYRYVCRDQEAAKILEFSQHCEPTPALGDGTVFGSSGDGQNPVKWVDLKAAILADQNVPEAIKTNVDSILVNLRSPKSIAVDPQSTNLNRVLDIFANAFGVPNDNVPVVQGGNVTPAVVDGSQPQTEEGVLMSPFASKSTGRPIFFFVSRLNKAILGLECDDDTTVLRALRAGGFPLSNEDFFNIVKLKTAAAENSGRDISEDASVISLTYTTKKTLPDQNGAQKTILVPTKIQFKDQDAVIAEYRRAQSANGSSSQGSTSQSAQPQSFGCDQEWSGTFFAKVTRPDQPQLPPSIFLRRGDGKEFQVPISGNAEAAILRRLKSGPFPGSVKFRGMLYPNIPNSNALDVCSVSYSQN